MYKLLSYHCFAAEWQYELLSTKYCPQLEDLPDTLLKLSFSEGTADKKQSYTAEFKIHNQFSVQTFKDIMKSCCNNSSPCITTIVGLNMPFVRFKLLLQSSVVIH